jgi:hypothetical protein
MQESLALVRSVENAPAADKCKAYSRHSDLADEIRESFARCEAPKIRTQAVRNADEVIDATQQAYEKWCPTRPGMVRVRMTMVTHVTREQLPKPLAAVHRCAGDAPMHSSNERFDLGRLVMLGCPGNPNPSAEDAKARNARLELLQKEQVAVYLTRDRDGDDPRRLTFPIFTADGREATTDLLLPVAPASAKSSTSSRRSGRRRKKAYAACMRSGGWPMARPTWCYGARRRTAWAASSLRPCSTGAERAGHAQGAMTKP